MITRILEQPCDYPFYPSWPAFYPTLNSDPEAQTSMASLIKTEEDRDIPFGADDPCASVKDKFWMTLHRMDVQDSYYPDSMPSSPSEESKGDEAVFSPTFLSPVPEPAMDDFDFSYMPVSTSFLGLETDVDPCTGLFIDLSPNLSSNLPLFPDLGISAPAQPRTYYPQSIDVIPATSRLSYSPQALPILPAAPSPTSVPQPSSSTTASVSPRGMPPSPQQATTAVPRCDFPECDVTFTSSRRDIDRHRASVHGPPVVLPCGDSLSYRPDNIARHRRKCTTCRAEAAAAAAADPAPAVAARPGRRARTHISSTKSAV